MTAKIVICSLLVTIAFAGDQSSGYVSQRSGSIGNDRLGGHGFRNQGVSNINTIGNQGKSFGVSGSNRLGRNRLGGKTTLLGGRSRSLSSNGLRSLTNNDGYGSQGTSSKSASFRSVGRGVNSGSYDNDRNIGSGVHQFSGNTGRDLGVSNIHDIGTGGATGYDNNRRISGNDGLHANGLSSTNNFGNQGLQRSSDGYRNSVIQGSQDPVHQDSFGSNSFSNIHPVGNQNRRLSGVHGIGNQNSLGSRGLSNSHSVIGQGIGQSNDGYGSDGISRSGVIGNQGILHSGSGSNNLRLSNNIHDQGRVNGGYDNNGRFNRGHSLVGNSGSNNGNSYVGGPLRRSGSLLRGGSNIHSDIHSNGGLIGNKGSGNVFNGRGLRNQGLRNNNNNVFANSGTHAINNRGVGRSGNGYGSNTVSGVHAIGNQDVHGTNSFSGDHSVGNQGSFGSNPISNSHPLTSQGTGQSYSNGGISGSNVIGNQGLLHPDTSSTNFRLSKPNSIGNGDGYDNRGRFNNGRSNVGNNVLSSGNSYSGSSLGRSSGVLSGGSGVHGDIHSNNDLINNRGSGSVFNKRGLNSGVHSVGRGRNSLGYNDVLSVGSGINNVGSVRGSGKFRNRAGVINQGLGSSHGNLGNVNNGVNTLHSSVVPVDHFNTNNGNIHGGSISGSRSIVGDHGSVGDQDNLGQGYSDNNRQVSFVNQDSGHGIATRGLVGGNRGNRDYNGINSNNVHDSNRLNDGHPLVRSNGLISRNSNVHGRRSSGSAQGYNRNNGIGNAVNSNVHSSSINNNNGYTGGVGGNRRIFSHGLNNGGGVVGHSRGVRGSNTGKRNCFTNSDLGQNFDFSDRAADFPREKIIRELQGRPRLRTRMGIEGAFMAKDFAVLTGFGKRRVHSRKRRAASGFGDNGFGDESAFDTPSDRTFDLQSSQQKRLSRLVKPNAEVCPSDRRPLRSFSMNGARCYTLNRRDRPTMFATCTRHDCPECSRNRGVGRCVEEFEEASVFAWCDGDSFSNNIREVSLLVPKHCGGKSYDC